MKSTRGAKWLFTDRPKFQKIRWTFFRNGSLQSALLEVMNESAGRHDTAESAAVYRQTQSMT